MAYEIKVTGGQLVDDANKVLDEEEVVTAEPVKGVLDTGEGAPITVDGLESVEPAAPEEVEDSYWDRFRVSKVQTWNPQTKQIEEVEMPTWQRAAKGVANGLKAYGLTLLKTGGDESQAWGAGLETAFGSLESEVAAQKKQTEWNKEITDLVKDAKYTPASIKAYAESGDATKLIQKEQVLTADQRRQGAEFEKTYKLEGEKFQELKRSNKVDEAIKYGNLRVSEGNLRVAEKNASTSEFSARHQLIEVEKDGEPGKVYTQLFDLATQKPLGEPVLKNSKEAKALQDKADEQNGKDDKFMLSYDQENTRIDELLNDDSRLYEATEGHGLIDAGSTLGMYAPTQPQKDRDYIKKIQSIETLEQMKDVFGAAATDDDLRELKSTFASLDDKRDTANFLKKVKEIRQRNATRIRVGRAEMGLRGDGKELGRVVREAPENLKEGDILNGGKYIVVDGFIREIKTK